MNKILIGLSMLLVTASACNYNEWSQTLSCFGREVNQFPNITDAAHIDIINTSLTNLPNITSFPNLVSMTIEDNAFLSCDDVNELKKNATHLVITTDCDDDDVFSFINPDCINLCVDILSNHII